MFVRAGDGSLVEGLWSDMTRAWVGAIPECGRRRAGVIGRRPVSAFLTEKLGLLVMILVGEVGWGYWTCW